MLSQSIKPVRKTVPDYSHTSSSVAAILSVFNLLLNSEKVPLSCCSDTKVVSSEKSEEVCSIQGYTYRPVSDGFDI